MYGIGDGYGVFLTNVGTKYLGREVRALGYDCQVLFQK